MVKDVNDAQLLKVIVDVSKWQMNLKMKNLKDQGIKAVIAKVTQGSSFDDPAYKDFTLDCDKNGMLFGAYHFGDNKDTGTNQAKHYLKDINHKGTLLMLDWEQEPKGNTMTATQAIDFIKTVFDTTGKYPVLYSGPYFLESQKIKDFSVIGNCPLFIARYMTTPPPQVKGFKPWVMWQYSGSSKMTFNDKGLIGQIDRDAFLGTEEELRKFWLEHSN